MVRICMSINTGAIGTESDFPGRLGIKESDRSFFFFLFGCGEDLGQVDVKGVSSSCSSSGVSGGIFKIYCHQL